MDGCFGGCFGELSHFLSAVGVLGRRARGHSVRSVNVRSCYAPGRHAHPTVCARAACLRTLSVLCAPSVNALGQPDQRQRDLAHAAVLLQILLSEFEPGFRRPKIAILNRACLRPSHSPSAALDFIEINVAPNTRKRATTGRDQSCPRPL